MAKLELKHPNLRESVNAELQRVANGAATGGTLVPRVNAHPVYKVRLPIGGQGKRRGARLIYYCSDELVVPLFLYVKSAQTDIEPKAILKALKAAGLAP